MMKTSAIAEATAKERCITEDPAAPARARSAGAEGGGRVTNALAALPQPWLTLKGRMLIPGVAESGLDHVLVGPAGVLLLDSKAWGGTVREWQGTLVEHVMAPDGEVVRRSLHAEVARAHRGALEMSSRLRLQVTPVVCLAGPGSARFGAPRLVRGIWVVPVDDVAGWLGARPSTVAPEELSSLQALVRGEFAATSDSSLLTSIGHDRQRSRAMRVRSRRAEATRRAAKTPRPQTRDSRAGLRRLRRRRERLRLLLTVAFLWGVFCVSVTGVMTGVLVSP